MALPAPAPSAGLGKVPEGSRISVNTKVTSAGRVQAQDGAHHHRADLPSSQSRSSSVIVSTDHVGPDIRRFIVTGSRTKATKLDVAIVVFACYALLRQNLVIATVLVCVLAARIIHAQLSVYEECVSVIQGLGIQLTRTYGSGARRHTFIEQSRIKDVIINEGITMCRVIFYMAFVVHDKDKMVLAFQHLFPRFPDLLPIYRGSRAVLFGEPE